MRLSAQWLSVTVFKPNISTLLGNIYNREDLRPKKDVAYNIFYMGINIGGFVCNFVAAYLRINYSWGYAFAAAGVGMVLSLIWFATGIKDVKHADIIKPPQKEDMPISKIGLYVFLPAILAGIIGWNIPGNLIGSDSNDAFIFASIPIIIFYFGLWYRAKGFDKARLGTLLYHLWRRYHILEHLQPELYSINHLGRHIYQPRNATGCREFLKPFGFYKT